MADVQSSDNGITIGEAFAKLKNYKFSAHTFSAIIGAIGVGYAASPSLQAAVKGFLAHANPWVVAAIPAVTAIYARYAPSRRTTQVSATIEPGEDAVVGAAAASANDETK